MPTDRALRPRCSRYIRARGAGPPEAISEAGAAPEIDRHTLSVRASRTLMVINRRPGSPDCSGDAYALTVHSKSKSKARFMTMRFRDARTDGHGGAVAH